MHSGETSPLQPTASESSENFYQFCFENGGLGERGLLNDNDRYEPGLGAGRLLGKMKSTVVLSQPIMRKSLFKIVILGDAAVGKTEIFNRLAKIKTQERKARFKSRTTDFEIFPGEFTNVEFVDAEGKLSF